MQGNGWYFFAWDFKGLSQRAAKHTTAKKANLCKIKSQRLASQEVAIEIAIGDVQITVSKENCVLVSVTIKGQRFSGAIY